MQTQHYGILGVIMAGVMAISGVYIALRYSQGASTVLKGATQSYSTVGKQFQKGY